eukprot:SAG22_NODE_1513_length_4254_cov_10.073887_4_plen_85_part_00
MRAGGDPTLMGSFMSLPDRFLHPGAASRRQGTPHIPARECCCCCCCSAARETGAGCERQGRAASSPRGPSCNNAAKKARHPPGK